MTKPDRSQKDFESLLWSLKHKSGIMGEWSISEKNYLVIQLMQKPLLRTRITEVISIKLLSIHGVLYVYKLHMAGI